MTAETLIISTFQSADDNAPELLTTNWVKLVQSLLFHRVQDHKGGRLWSPAVYVGKATRAKDSDPPDRVEVFGADLDDGTDVDTLADWLRDTEYVVSSTYSHQPERPKLRVAIRLLEPIPHADFSDTWRRINQHRFHGHLDPSTKDIKRMYYVPSRPPDGPEPIAIHHPGKPLDWRALPPLPKPKPLPKKSRSEANLSDDQRRAERLLAKWESDLASEPSGGRHRRLCQLGYAAGGLVANGLLDSSTVETCLYSACESNGLVAEDGQASVERTLSDVLAAGTAEPWTPDDLPDSAAWQARPRTDRHNGRHSDARTAAGISRNGHDRTVDSVAVMGGTVPDGAELLDDVYAFLGRFVVYPTPHAHVAHTLWIVHTHLMAAWESTPRLAFLSPEPSSGKTRALEITELLVPGPVLAVNVTAAYIFRKVGDEGGRPTILYDEIDTVFGPKAKENEDIRGLLNAGHRKGAVAGRCVVHGKRVETEEIPAYCAVALAGLGGLPDTILTRSIVVRMRRRAPGEHVEPYRRRIHRTDAEPIRRGLQAWAERTRSQVGNPWPSMPPEIADRDADAWEPLLAIADAAGEDWGKRARCAAVALVTESRTSTPSLGIRLLADIRHCFGDRLAMSTEDLIGALCKLDEAPWGELDGGKPINARGLAKRLRQYGIGSKVIRIGDATPRGYARADLWDAWQRYLPREASVGELSLSPDRSATSATSVTTAGPPVGSEPPAVAHVADATPFVADPSQETQLDVSHVADVAHFPGNGEIGGFSETEGVF